MSSERRVLFVCTGNYYRSRFAEELWNQLEREDPLGWRGDSCGLRVGSQVGPISWHTLEGLRARAVPVAGPAREPRQAAEEDFAGAGHVVAVSGAEHRAMMLLRFPRWADTIEYWDVEDIGLCEPNVAMDRLDEHVRGLRARLPRQGR